MRFATLRTPVTIASSDRATAAVTSYLDDIGAFGVLSLDEERALGERAMRGDDDAIRDLVNANLRFVVSVAKRYQHRGLPLTDLIGEGNIGLLAAARRFDPSRGVRFVTYAAWWIRQSMLAALTRNAHQV